MNNHTYNRIKLIRKETLLQQIQVESDDYSASWLTHLTSPAAVSSYQSQHANGPLTFRASDSSGGNQK